MAPKKTKARPSSVTAETNTSNTTSQDASQDTQSKHIHNVMEKVKQRKKERRQKRKDEILKAHQDRTEKLHADIKQCVEEHDKKVRTMRRPKVERLLELEKKKRALEQQVEDIEVEVRQAYLATARQLQIAIEARREGLSE